jgi:hypothetical protein
MQQKDFHKENSINATGTNLGLTGHIVNSPIPKEHFLNRSRTDSDSDWEGTGDIHKTTLSKLSKAFHSDTRIGQSSLLFGLENEKMVLVGYGT